MSVFDDLVSQESAVRQLQSAVQAAHDGTHAMTHAWLFTGPAGSGRSNAAVAFAAALLCPRDGCGECNTCRTTLDGTHPDVTIERSEKLTIGVDTARELASKSFRHPTAGTYQVIIVEDSDRLTEAGANALLKALEEPPSTTVWMLCAPTPDDVLVTIRSRTRRVALRTPRIDDVTSLLVSRDGVDQATAAYAARASQGHIGRARALATNEVARRQRRQVCEIPAKLTGVAAALDAASFLIKLADEHVEETVTDLNATEMAKLRASLGMDTKGLRVKNTATAIKDLETQQQLRAKRMQRDAIDFWLTELSTWYRDVLSVQLGAVEVTGAADDFGHGLINAESRAEIARAAKTSTPEQTIARVDAILAARDALDRNVTPQLALEALMLDLVDAQSLRI